jgi:hypothetical protein
VVYVLPVVGPQWLRSHDCPGDYGSGDHPQRYGRIHFFAHAQTLNQLFVVQGEVPAEWYRLRDNQYTDLEEVEIDIVRLDVAQYDPVKQLL